MYKHILIPTQLDSTRDVAMATTAAQQLLSDGGRITFLHVLEPLPASIGTYLPEGYPQETRDALKAKLDELTATVPGSQAILADGPAGRTITNWADDNGVDCIAIPSHQPTFSDVFLGSTAAWVVKHAHCAVHVVR